MFGGDEVCILFIICVLRVKELVYEFQRYLRLKLIIALSSNRNYSGTALCILQNGNDIFTFATSHNVQTLI